MKQTRTQDPVALKRLTTFHIGGQPLLYVRPENYIELRASLSLCRRRNLPFRVLGGGSNLLVGDGPLPFAVIHVCAPGFAWIKRIGPATMKVGAGIRMRRLLRYCEREGLGGLEFMAGIPGTIAGALVGNAGAWGRSMGQVIRRAWRFDDELGKVETPVEDMGLGYRTSRLGGLIITEVEIELEPRSPELVARMARRYAIEKARRHPMNARSAGCVFKNPPGLSAGKVLDICGFKGVRVGGAQVSPVHANFICNIADASEEDVLQLIDRMRRKAHDVLGVDLELEIKHWSPESKVA